MTFKVLGDEPTQTVHDVRRQRLLNWMHKVAHSDGPQHADQTNAEYLAHVRRTMQEAGK